ncbi:MAG: four helix bundle protein [Flavisolibacter sp.]
MFLKLNHQQFDIYKATRAFVKECYIATSEFPQEEKFALIQQIRRAAFSVHLNLSEGFSRKSTAERKRFFEMSRGSIVEIDGALDAAEDLGYCKKERLTQLGVCMNSCFSMLSKLISN